MAQGGPQAPEGTDSRWEDRRALMSTRSNVWTGFAGVAQTTVERLLREGGARDEDATAAPLADKLATLQHIMGGACTGADMEYRAAVGRLSDATGAICRKLRRAGGVGTDLWDTVTRAVVLTLTSKHTHLQMHTAGMRYATCLLAMFRTRDGLSLVDSHLKKSGNITNCSTRASQKNGGNS